MTEAMPTSSVLFGPDGTQLPDPLPVLPDPLHAPLTGPHRGSWGDPPLSLPAAPDAQALQEAMAAVFTAGLLSADDLADPPRPTGSDGPAGGPTPAAGHPGGRPPGHRPPPGPAAARAPHPPGAAAAQALPPVRSIDLSRSVDQLGRWSGGVQSGCVIALIIVGLVVLTILAEFVGSVARLFQ